MGNIVLENVPSSITKKMGKKIDFKEILGLYWDGMDWCQYDEVIPTENDISSFKKLNFDLSEKDGEKFLSDLLKKDV